VNRENHRMYRGLARHLKMTHFVGFRPPKGLGKRLGPSGFKAGAHVDQAVTAILDNKSLDCYPKWAVNRARGIINGFKKCGLVNLKSQVVVHCDETNLATAVDLYGKCKKTGKYYVIEIKYSSHSCNNLRTVYKTPGKNRNVMKACKRKNSIFEQHAMQVGETARLFSKCFNIPKCKIQPLVVVVGYDNTTILTRVSPPGFAKG
jgi:hypothetical protein